MTRYTYASLEERLRSGCGPRYRAHAHILADAVFRGDPGTYLLHAHQDRAVCPRSEFAVRHAVRLEYERFRGAMWSLMSTVPPYAIPRYVAESAASIVGHGPERL